MRATRPSRDEPSLCGHPRGEWTVEGSAMPDATRMTLGGSMADTVVEPTVNLGLEWYSDGKTGLQRWFEGSRVVDSTGMPLVVYHGAKYDFSAFEEQEHHPDCYGGPAFFFTSNPDYASAEAGTRRGQPHVKPCFLRMVNPLVLDYAGSPWCGDTEAVLQARMGGHDGLIRLNMVSALRGYSFDEYVVFEPTQIKSAIGNSGAFDGRNPDLRA